MIKDIFIKNLFENKNFFDKVYPYINQYYTYLRDDDIKTILSKISEYVTNYKNNPDYETIMYELDKIHRESIKIKLSEIQNKKLEKKDLEWLIDETEKYFQKEALYRTIMDSADIILDGKENKYSIPDNIRNALQVSLRETKIEEYGSEYELENQYYYYHTDESRFVFPNWNRMNSALGGGLGKKRVLCFISKPNTGKTMLMVNCDIELLKQGYNVLHISFEDSKEGISERIDGNILNQNTENLKYIEKKKYFVSVREAVKKMNGRLFIREYPATSVNTIHIEKLIDELKIKHDFVPDVITIDYLNLMLSKRFKRIGSNSYEYIKAIVEELRGLASEKGIGIITAAQFNRGAGSNPSMDDVAESYGIAMTADIMIAIIESDELRRENKQMLKQLRNRVKAIKPENEKWIIKLDKDKQKIIGESDLDTEELNVDDDNVNIPKPVIIDQTGKEIDKKNNNIKW